MERIAFAEILNRMGRVKDRIRISSFPVAIGRAYTNDIILDDKYVCPEHLRLFLNEDGEMIAEDCGSVNGLYQLSPQKRVSKARVGPDTLIRAGHTILRFRWMDHEVVPAEAETSGWKLFPRLLQHNAISLGLFLLSLAVLLTGIFLDSYTRYTFSDFLDDAMALLMLFIGWSGLWAFVNRIVSHSFRFLSHLAVAGAVLIGITVFSVTLEYLSFIFFPSTRSDYIELFGMAILFAILILGHLLVISTAQPFKKLIAAVVISFAILGSYGFFEYTEKSEFSNAISFSSAIKPVDTKWLRTVTPDQFFGGLERFKK